ncbi:hypothetical protein O3P69_016470 [Scylla paramamosain]|uniref:Uncharacterized protein n=1 Tax=Scylla paramamosain TaxID=85552 RepID=A0AAW0TDF0_SCYPA
MLAPGPAIHGTEITSGKNAVTKRGDKTQVPAKHHARGQLAGSVTEAGWVVEAPQEKDYVTNGWSPQEIGRMRGGRGGEGGRNSHVRESGRGGEATRSHTPQFLLACGVDRTSVYVLPPSLNTACLLCVAGGRCCVSAGDAIRLHRDEVLDILTERRRAVLISGMSPVCGEWRRLRVTVVGA